MSFDKSLFERRIKIMVAALFVAIALYVVGRFSGCGVGPDVPEDSPVPEGACGSLELGDTRKTACPGGQDFKIEACTETGIEVLQDCDLQNPIPDCGKTLFSEVKPLIDAKCVSCHPGYINYPTVKGAVNGIVQRINLQGANPQRMPKPPNPELTPDQKDLIKRWQSDGALDVCPGGIRQTHIPFKAIETAMRDKAQSLSEVDRLNGRFLVLSHRVNQRATEEEIVKAISGADKTINSIAPRAQRLTKMERFGPEGSILYLDLNDYRLNRQDWEVIIAADQFQLESFTDDGLLLKFLTQTKRPWMHFDNFIDLTHRNSELYYRLLGVPATLDELARLQGVDFVDDLKNFEALLVGTNHSPISLQKNRMIGRWESGAGYFWVTFDPIALGGVRERNLFEAPLLADAGGSGRTNFDFAASEVIYSLPNGLQAYALYANVVRSSLPPQRTTVRENFAPINIVTDTESPLSPEIRNANSCVRCHSSGLIPAIDEIRDHVTQNASQFERGDVDIVRALYKPNPLVTQVFEEDRREFAVALSQLGVDPSVDPMSQATDRLLLNWNAIQAAAFFFLTIEEFAECLNGSAALKAEIGQLLTGGTVTYDQILTSKNTIVRDCRLFQNPVGG